MNCVSIVFQVMYFMSCLHYFQWKGYYAKRYLKYLFKNKLIIILNILFFIQTVLNILKISLNLNIFIINLIFFIFNLIILLLFLFKKKKIKFTFTLRIFRLIILNMLVLLLAHIINPHSLYIYTLLTPFALLLIDSVDIQKYRLNIKAKTIATSKLNANKNLITIGVTGSNGKTSVKEILNKILSTKYNVITTQKNQNTPKGAILAINKYLSNDTEIFICEMGARLVGDIKKICNFVRPNLGIITSVCPQHLETFKTEKNIYLTKKELPDYLNQNYCVYNIDNNLVKQMHDEKIGNRGCVSTKVKTKLHASNIQTVNFKTYFDIVYNSVVYPCHTNLLGEHNITNILLALDIALRLGVEINTAIQAIINLPPTPHRLEYIKARFDIIDDTYNCSIDSAKQALNLLNTSNKLKVVCTPGIIEGGRQQVKLNQELSRLIAQTCNIAIIVGKTNRNALLSNLNNYNISFVGKHNKLIKHPKISINEIKPANKNQVYVVDNLNIAKQIFTKILNSSHVLLLLNDLPDEYN